MKTQHSARRARLNLELLEDRSTPAVFVVTSTSDSGSGSLRDAIRAANKTAAADIINFNVPGDGVQTINLATALPTVTSPVTIAGTTQSGYAGTPLIELDGAATGSGANGLTISAPNCTVRGLIIGNFGGSGIVIQGTNARVTSCTIGSADLDGSVAMPNRFHGILITGAATGARIGGINLSDRNSISNNGLCGVAILGTRAQSNVVQGNYILRNSVDGVFIGSGAKNNTIGGTNAELITRNLISGNRSDGVEINGAGTTGNIVVGNSIGLTATADNDLGNLEAGVQISNGATRNRVGGLTFAERNYIAGNDESGVEISGAGTISNTVQGNMIGRILTGGIGAKNGHGVLIRDGATNNVIGGTVTGARNVISGNNNNGVSIWGVGTNFNSVQGNFIGTDDTGYGIGYSNAMGVEIADGAANNAIGGQRAEYRNIISVNIGAGVSLRSAGATNLVQGHYIGTNVDGTGALANGVGISIDSSSNNVIGGSGIVRNVISGNSGSGIEIKGNASTGNTVLGNFIGTNATATAALPNAVGIDVSDSAHGNHLGSTQANARNIIAGNLSSGVVLRSNANNNVLQASYVGNNGISPIANGQDGVVVDDAWNNTIGGATANARNLISGNGRNGLRIEGSLATGNVVYGNNIGLGLNSTAPPMGNVLHGIFVTDQAANNSLGGTAAGAGNTIANNGGDGVLIGRDSAFGFDTTAGHGNAVQANCIYNNGGIGIDLGGNDDRTANDDDDVDTGANQLINKPLLTSAFLLGQSLEITGAINTQPNKVLRIEFFASATGTQGETFLGFLNVAMGPSKWSIWTHELTVPTSVRVGHHLTATVTDELGNTSEFSLDLIIE